MDNVSAMEKGFVKVASLDELSECGGIQRRVSNREVALFRLDGEIQAIDGECPHMGAFLGEGLVEDGHVYCPMHGWGFNIRTGECSTSPNAKTTCFEVKELDGGIWVRL